MAHELSEDALLDFNECQEHETQGRAATAEESQVLSILTKIQCTLTAVDKRSRQYEQA